MSYFIKPYGAPLLYGKKEKVTKVKIYKCYRSSGAYEYSGGPKSGCIKIRWLLHLVRREKKVDCREFLFGVICLPLHDHNTTDLSSLFSISLVFHYSLLYFK